MKMKLASAILLSVVLAAGAYAQGTWTTKAPMPTPRGALATAVVNGIIYAIGGATTNGAPLSVVEAYDSASDTWSSKASLPFPIERAAAGSVNGIIYLVGGCADNACGALLNTVYAYDPTTDTWTQKASIPTPRRDFGVAVIGGILYALGGNQGPGYVCLASVEAYDPVANTWTEKSPLPVGRFTVSAAADNGILYAVGGNRTTAYCGAPFGESSELDAYDPANNTWTTKGPMLTALSDPGVGVINGVLYVVGGDAAPTLNQAYNPVTNTWNLAAPMPTSRIGPAAAVVNGTLYAIGGFGGGVFLGTNEAFTPSVPLGQGTWITKTSMSTTRPNAVSANINGKLYVVGGNNGQTLASMEAYDPSTDAWASLAPLPQLDFGQPGRYGGAAAAIGGKLYLPGGWRTVPPLPTNTLLVYDPGSNSWSTKAPMPSLSACSAAGAIDDKLYVLTACNGFSGYVSRLDMYDPGTDSWVGRASCPHVHSSPGAAVINGKFYVAGGFDGSQISGTLDVYDPTTDSWTTALSMPTVRAGLAGDVIGGRFYTVGGSGTAQPLATLEIYDPSTNTWTSGPSMLTPRGGLVASAINGQLYAVGGGNNSGPLATNEVFIQNSPPVAMISGPTGPVECASHSGTQVILDGSGSHDPDGDTLTYAWTEDSNAVGGNTPTLTVTVPLGTHTFALTVTDPGGLSNTATTQVTVQDTTPPSLSVALSPNSLWPPNHSLIPITANITVSDTCDANPSVVLVSITANEPLAGDIQDATFGTDDRSFELAATRLGSGNGRIYTVTYKATDHSGNSTTVNAQVIVPHDQGN